MDFLIQPVDGECCVDPCGRRSPCDPCEGTTTTLEPTTSTTLEPTTSTTFEPTTSTTFEPTTSTTFEPTTSPTIEPCLYYFTDSGLTDTRSSSEGDFVYIIFETEQCARESSSTFSAFLVTINGMQYWSPIFF